jgi:F0F1-type ATP synthase delta subunit
MKTSRRQLAGVIARSTLHAGFTRQDAMHIAEYLLQERRTSDLDSLLRDVREQWAQDGYVEVLATGARALSSQVRADIEAEARYLYPDASRIVITEQIQPDLVGGVRIEVIGRQLDLTTRHTLQQFKMLATRGKDSR